MSSPFSPPTDPAMTNANRQGTLTDEQKKYIVSATTVRAWGIAGGLVVLVGALTICVFSALEAPGAIGIISVILGLGLLFCLFRGAQMLLLRRALFSDKILATQGQVTFVSGGITDPSKYITETGDDLKLKVIGLAGVGVTLRPGPYRFYYLPTRSWLLSAEPLASESELNANLMETLAAANNWDISQIKQWSQLSPAQLAEQQIYMQEGPVTTAFTPASTPIHDDDEYREPEYYYQLDDLKFPVSEPAHSALLDGLRYRLYYNDEQLLGVEPLGS